MTRPAEVLSEIVAEIRLLRSGGARASDIANNLVGRGLIDSEVQNHFEAAFGISIIDPMYLPREPNGLYVGTAFDELVEPRIAAAGKAWLKATSYPDLLRRRDRYAFRGLARETGNVFVVQAAPSEAAQYVGKPGFKPFPLHLLDIARLEAPHVGLIAADPESRSLHAALAALRPALTYEGYLQRLTAEGFSVAGASEGFVISDHKGTRFYPGYRLLGVYGARSGTSAWSGADGERMRWQLNRRMGVELVQFGPHDDWEGRRAIEPGSPFRGPLAPALFFTPDGNVTVEFDTDDIETAYRFYGIDWAALYPSEPASPEEDKEDAT